MANHAQVAPIQGASALSVLANPFRFHAFDVRTAIGPDGEPWFCAKDVCEALDIVWSGGSKTIGNLPDRWKGVVNLPTPGGVQDTLLISLAGCYRLIFRSNKPIAEEFAEWVCEEVLPAIHKYGFYGKLDFKDMDKNVRRITELCELLPNTKHPFDRTQKIAELRYRSNMMGWPMPDLNLLENGQTTLEGF